MKNTNKKIQQAVVLDLDDIIEIAKRLDKELNETNGRQVCQPGQIQYFLFKSIRDYIGVDFLFLKD